MPIAIRCWFNAGKGLRVVRSSLGSAQPAMSASRSSILNYAAAIIPLTRVNFWRLCPPPLPRIHIQAEQLSFFGRSVLSRCGAPPCHSLTNPRHVVHTVGRTKHKLAKPSTVDTASYETFDRPLCNRSELLDHAGVHQAMIVCTKGDARSSLGGDHPSGLLSRPARSWMNCQATRPEREPRVIDHSLASALSCSTGISSP